MGKKILIGHEEGNSLGRVVTHRPGEVVGSPSSKSFESHLAEALRSLISPQSSLQGWTKDLQGSLTTGITLK